MNIHNIHIHISVLELRAIHLFLISGFICYDDGCHLRKYARSVKRSTVSPAATALANVEIVVDKLHMRGHTDKWCAENCDPHKFEELNDVCKL